MEERRGGREKFEERPKVQAKLGWERMEENHQV